MWRDRGGIPERPKGPDCKSGGDAFAGSNPAPPTVSPGLRWGKGAMHCGRVWGERESSGRSSMVEPRPSKPVMWVRFPSPACQRRAARVVWARLAATRLTVVATAAEGTPQPRTCPQENIPNVQSSQPSGADKEATAAQGRENRKLERLRAGRSCRRRPCRNNEGRTVTVACGLL
jgi:hypothetical protein